MRTRIIHAHFRIISLQVTRSEVLNVLNLTELFNRRRGLKVCYSRYAQFSSILHHFTITDLPLPFSSMRPTLTLHLNVHGSVGPGSATGQCYLRPKRCTEAQKGLRGCSMDSSYFYVYLKISLPSLRYIIIIY